MGLRRAGGAAGVAVLRLASGSQPVAAQDEEDGEPRIVDLDFRESDLEPRIVDLTYRSTSFGGATTKEETPEEVRISLAADVLFEFDRADLTPAAETRLEELAGELDELGPRTVTIAGHTDNHGEPPYNQDLSERRAEAVRSALASHLGDGFTFEVAGHGESQPVAPNEHEDGSDNPEGRALNRRVEITFPS
jgi:outer membrane protein OmpA-like peptidoglycan-associated protein